MTRHPAFDRQVTAADPTASTFLSANAGSGKTRVLTDRVARLLLNGVEPQHILCLTYTKAAASEMQNRLFALLGRWAMMPDADLRAALLVLGEGAVTNDNPLSAARKLFARAIETPGGLRIQTIHSFCASLLRRFPLEAGVSPQFTELDDRAAKMLRSEIVEELAEYRAPDVMAEVALAYAGDDFSTMMQQVAGSRAGFAAAFDDAASQQLFGHSGDSLAAILADVLLGGEAQLLSALIAPLTASGPADARAADRLAVLDVDQPGLALLAGLEDVLLTGEKSKDPFSAKIGSFPTKALQKVVAPLMPGLDALMLRVEAARPRRISLMAAQKTAALHRFAAVFLPLYATRKAERGFLDFDDLITRAKLLLTDRSVAEWVLFRLDGGIDHILVDEAQDTSPDQWRVIELLAAEFTAGHGARDRQRTLFVVGDKKQSIYSFQGADVAAFEVKRAEFQARFDAVGQKFQNEKLEHSFRSAPAILQLVDRCFGGDHPALGGLVSHLAFRTEKPGRVDLWPLVEPVKTDPDDNWDDPIGLIRETHHAARLAKSIADEIARMIAAGTRIVTADGTRAVHAGDFLILVQRRSDLFGEIIRACKKAGLPIAGADRLKLGAELAVKDLTALLAFLAVPEDDLSLAALLRSPLLGWTEGELYDLAQGRKGYLWESLRASNDHPDTQAILTDLRDRSDFLRPFDLIERVLTRHDGRRRLLARLGPEAEDGIDELLSQALSYEQTEVPSLTGFLIWLDSDEIVVKRQGDSEGSRIRVMTVHGAKGLESEIVILPDCADRQRRERDEIFTTASGVPIWKTPANLSPPLVTQIRAERLAAAEAENLRLLYVALTRARCWLIVAAAGKAEKPDSWYRLVAAAMAGASPGVHGRLRQETGDWPDPAPPVARAVAPDDPLPDWLEQPVARSPGPAEPVTPSGLGGAKVLPGEETGGRDADFAKARGTALHQLLELFPTLPQADWPLVAAARADPLLAAELLAEARRVVGSPDLANLFGPASLAEVPFAVPFRDKTLIGAVDRVVITPDRIFAVDFKSNRLIPATPEQVPEGLLRQMGAYDHALRLIYPDHHVETAILWTRTAQLMVLPPEIVRAALCRATTDGEPALDVAAPDA